MAGDEGGSAVTHRTATLWDRELILPGDADLTVDVYVRSLSPSNGTHAGRVEFVEELERLEAERVIRDATVSIWGDRICRCETCSATGAGRAALERLREFEAWSEDVDADVSLPFERRSISSEFVDRTLECVVPPHITVAVYGGSSLVGVFPCEVDDDDYTVRDAVVALRRATRTGQYATVE
jgi:hypothetical protein